MWQHLLTLKSTRLIRKCLTGYGSKRKKITLRQSEWCKKKRLEWDGRIMIKSPDCGGDYDPGITAKPSYSRRSWTTQGIWKSFFVLLSLVKESIAIMLNFWTIEFRTKIWLCAMLICEYMSSKSRKYLSTCTVRLSTFRVQLAFRRNFLNGTYRFVGFYSHHFKDFLLKNGSNERFSLKYNKLKHKCHRTEFSLKRSFCIKWKSNTS